MVYNNTVIDNGVIDNVGIKVMATKDHSLDNKIIDAALEEFSNYGFQKASLHKIANKAEVTTGALYTRYKNKDALFTALINPLLDDFKPYYKDIADRYYKAQAKKDADSFIEAMKYECDIYFEVLISHKNQSNLLFNKSNGSEAESLWKKFIDMKIEGTVSFFETFAKEKSKRENSNKILEDFAIDRNAISMLMNMQFSLFEQVINLELNKEDAKKCINTLDDFIVYGWKNLFEKYL